MKQRSLQRLQEFVEHSLTLRTPHIEITEYCDSYTDIYMFICTCMYIHTYIYINLEIHRHIDISDISEHMDICIYM